MKTYTQFIAEAARTKQHTINMQRAQKELDQLDAQYGDKIRTPGTRRHNLHKQIESHKKAIAQGNADFKARFKIKGD